MAAVQMMTRMTTSNLARNVAAVHARIADACARSGRNVDDITLVAVSKTVDCAIVGAAAHLPEELACHVFGENRVQELQRKVEGCPDQTFHMIGTLQRNKVRHVVGNVALIHSVDSQRLLDEIDRQACAKGVVQDVLLQVNVSGEETKQGLEAFEVGPLLEYSRALAGVNVVGLMTMAPFGEPEESRPFFRALRMLGELHGLSQLSMGMSNDYEVAVEEGATLLRVGSALFG